MSDWVSAVAALLSAIAAWGAWCASKNASILTEKIANDNKLLSQRQLIVPLWEYISSLRKFDPSNPITADAIININALELIALCCEGQMIDENIIKRTFKKPFIEHFDDIKRCKNIGDGRSGDELIRENNSSHLFYDTLMNEQKKDGALNNG